MFFLPHIQKKKSLNPLYHKTIKLSREQINRVQIQETALVMCPQGLQLVRSVSTPAHKDEIAV